MSGGRRSVCAAVDPFCGAGGLSDRIHREADLHSLLRLRPDSGSAITENMEPSFISLLSLGMASICAAVEVIRFVSESPLFKNSGK